MGWPALLPSGIGTSEARPEDGGREASPLTEHDGLLSARPNFQGACNRPD
jgi:hypothetical protein